VADIAETLEALAETLNAAGVRTVTDPRDVNPPCALTLWPRFQWSFGGLLLVEYRLLVVVPSTGSGPALKALGPLMDQVAQALGGLPLEATPTAWPAPDGGDPLPAYELTWTAKTRP
jgi:hypothetical protein